MPKKRSSKRAKRYLSPEKRKGRGLLPPAPYRSWLEADVAQDMRRRNIKFKYEEEKVPYMVPAQAHTYIPDFSLADGLIIEVKGRWTAHDRKKMGLVIEQNPHLDIRILFARDNTISKSSNTRYSDWCRRRCIKYAIGDKIPEEWINES